MGVHMLTIEELQALLNLNTRLTIEALRSNASTQRFYELATHRQAIKDCMLELLLKRVS